MPSKPSLWFAVLLTFLVCAAPTLVEARAGGGASFGSRGSRTYNSVPWTPTAPQVRPLDRGMAPRTAVPRPSTPFYGRSAMFAGHPFLSGLMGGLLGAGLAGLLLGHGFFGYGLGIAGLLGLVLQLALLAIVFRVAMAAFRGRLYAAGPRSYAYATADDAGPRPGYGARAASPSDRPASRDEIGITGSDYVEFERLLLAVQTAWSRHDIEALRRDITPEMVSYFSEKLSANASAGIDNRVEDVRFEAGDLAEAWNDGDLHYATVAMRWSARDYTVRMDTGAPVDGRDAEWVMATEAWTFVRAPGGRWLLSAIQQI
jgi:predicted lipid-binding transport protein (Tim44 family)